MSNSKKSTAFSVRFDSVTSDAILPCSASFLSLEIQAITSVFSLLFAFWLKGDVRVSGCFLQIKGQNNFMFVKALFKSICYDTIKRNGGIL